MTEIIKASKPELAAKAAEIIKDSVVKLLKLQDQVVLAVVGGRSVGAVFKLLKEKNIPWNKIHIFMVDERLVPLDDPQSNFKLVKDSFLKELIDNNKLPQQNAHPFRVEQGIAAYEKELKSVGGGYDLVLLSVGEDGHVGGLFPNHDSVKADADYFVEFHNSPKPPPDRMTMSRKLLLKSQVAILLFFGEGKQEAFKNFSDKTVDFRTCPAKLVPSIKESFVLTDLV